MVGEHALNNSHSHKFAVFVLWPSKWLLTQYTSYMCLKEYVFYLGWCGLLLYMIGGVEFSYVLMIFSLAIISVVERRMLKSPGMTADF